ncbi:MAG: serine hydrolase [Luteitalea sp.]|nr:serine hydrolase [Luteitalea sp.]
MTMRSRRYAPVLRDRGRATGLRCLALVGLLALFTSPLAAQGPAQATAPAAAAEYAAAVADARTLSAALVEEANLPGLSVAVGIDGAVICSEGFGYADVEQRVPVTPLTRFRIGSVSKPLTAVAIGLLHEREQLDLDAPVQKYVSDFPEKRWPITTRQLAGHIAGIRHYRDDEFLSARHYDDVLEGLEIFADDPLLFQPGTDYRYSSYGWNLISAVVQAAAGVDFLTFMEREVFTAMGMRHTASDQVGSIISHRVRYYEHDEDGRLVNAPYVDNSYKWAGGGFLSTPEDLVLFGFRHIRDPFLRPETVELLFASQRLSSGKETDYGIGWSIGLDWHGRQTVGHGGGSVGGTTVFLTYPAEELVVAVTSNLTGAPGLSGLAFALAELFVPPAAKATKREEVATGRFTFRTEPTQKGNPPDATLEIVRTPDGYTGWLHGDDAPYARVVLVRPEAGAMRVFAVGSAGLVTLWLRLDGTRVSGRWVGPDGDVALEGQRVGG